MSTLSKHKLANPRLRHLHAAYTLKHPPLLLQPKQLRAMRRPPTITLTPERPYIIRFDKMASAPPSAVPLNVAEAYGRTGETSWKDIRTVDSRRPPEEKRDCCHPHNRPPPAPAPLAPPSTTITTTAAAAAIFTTTTTTNTTHARPPPSYLASLLIPISSS